jgi:hypothetical protein
LEKLILSVVVSLSLTACAGVSIESLQRNAIESSINIDDKILQTSVKYGGWKDGLMPGKYTAIGSDKKGTYYLGKNHPKIEIIPPDDIIPSNGEIRRCEGGFFVPFDPNKSMHFIYIMGTCGPQEDIDKAVLNQTSTNITNSYGVTGTAVGGLGAGIGMGIVGGMVAAEQGKIFWARDIDDKKIIELIRSKVKR